MSLNKKTFIFTSSIVGIALLGVIITSQTILLGGFQDVENKLAQRNAKRAVIGIQNEASRIDTLNSDWTHWDDAYDFVQNKNQEFIDVNVVDTTLSEAKLNVVIFADNEGSIVYSKGYSEEEDKEVPVAESLKSHVNRQDLLLTHVGKEAVVGVISTAEGPMLVSSRPILKSNGDGPSRGTLIMASYIGTDEAQKISEFSQVPVSFQKIGDGTPDNFGQNDKEEFLVKKSDHNTLYANAPIIDIYGKPVLAARVELQREIINQGKTTLNYFLLVTLLIGSIVMAGGVYFQDKAVLAPIYKLSKGLNKIRGKRDLSERVEVIGNDEISILAQDVNAMLNSLQDFHESSKENEKKLAEKVEVITKQNIDLTSTKAAMLNLLEDEKELEETLRKEHDRLDLILNSMGEGLLVIDTDFNVTAMNPAAEKLLETKAKVIVGKKWSELAATYKKESPTPLSERSFTKAIKEGKTTITSLEEDHWYKTATGKNFPIVSVTAPLSVAGKIVGAVKVFRDASHEKQSKDAIEKQVADRTRQLWEERARMFASINSLHMGFIVADAKNEIIVKNPAVSELLKINDSEITVAKLAEEFKANFDLMAECAKCIEKSASWGKDDVYYKDKFLRVFLTPVVPEEVDKFKGFSNEEIEGAIGYVLLIEDVTNEKQLARAKDEFFAVASHELRTPLTAIRGNTSLIMDYYSEKIQDPDLKEMVSDMHESSIRLINIVNDFLDASRLEQGKVQFKKDEVDLLSVMKGSVSELGELANQRNLKVTLDESGFKEIKVLGDSERISQIADNLLGNAIKFSKAGDIKIGFTNIGENIKVTVTDSGAGISPANKRLLFKKFQQAGEKVLARDTTKGTGMGLYISKLLAEGMGGKIYLESSELGKGSTFAFELPMKKGGN